MEVNGERLLKAEVNDGGVWAGRAKGANTPPSLYVAHERMHSARESYRRGCPQNNGKRGNRNLSAKLWKARVILHQNGGSSDGKGTRNQRK